MKKSSVFINILVFTMLCLTGFTQTNTVNGTFIYNNSANTPMISLTNYLMDTVSIAASTTLGINQTDVSGNYSFSNIADSTYKIKASTCVPWGGVTATDALKMKRHIAGMELLTEPIRLSAADVNNSGTINATDVLKVQRRIASLDLSFAKPDWLFEMPTTGGNTITVNGVNLTQNFYAICTGDVNGTYVPPANPTITDKDNNIYDILSIGTQCWFKQNLKTTRYRDSTAIPNVTDSTVWNALTTSAYSDYNNVPSNSDTYGRLYNWYSTIDMLNICPTGFHVPSDTDWHTLALAIDVNAQLVAGTESFIAGGKMKEAGTAHWDSPNTGADNSSGFTALPGGFRGYIGDFNGIGQDGYWWSSSTFNINYAQTRNNTNTNAVLKRKDMDKYLGLSVRCVRNL